MRVLLVSLLHLLSVQLMGQNLPNIVYILADDMGIGDVSSYNPESKIFTENIDWLAQNGLKFTDAHTSSSVCTPTRYGILTGRYNWRSKLKSGVLSGYSAPLIEMDRMTVGHLMQSQGYHTGFVGKWHLGWEWSFKEEAEELNHLDNRFEVDYNEPIKKGPRAEGFDFSYGFSGSLDMPPYVYVRNDTITAAPNRITRNVDDKGFWREGETGADFDHVQVLPHLTEEAVQYIRKQTSSDNPFFLYYALPAPHTPILPITGFMGQSNTNLYGDFMLQVDDVVGQLIQALRETGELENTILIFTSDNGCSPRASFPELERVGHHPSYIYRGHKADIYEGGHRVPFLVHWPKMIKKGRVSDRLVCTTDLMHTLAELTGATLPPEVGEDSFSFLGVLTGESGMPIRESIVHHSIEGRFAIRRDNWKLVLWPGSGGWSEPRTNEGLEDLPSYQLFDLGKDPGERDNQMHQYTSIVDTLKNEMMQLIKKGRSTVGPDQQNDGDVPWEQVRWAF